MPGGPPRPGPNPRPPAGAAGLSRTPIARSFGVPSDSYESSVERATACWATLMMFRLGADGGDPGAAQPLGLLLVVLRRHQVPRELLLDEHVVGLVGVERGDHVVPVPPRLGVVEVDRLAGRLGEPGDVEPVPAPPLAE